MRNKNLKKSYNDNENYYTHEIIIISAEQINFFKKTNIKRINKQFKI